MKGWHFILLDLMELDHGDGWVADWVYELVDWPERYERWQQA